MASPAPRLETAPQTLAAVVPTAFVLVDRVRQGQGTPTEWSTALWRGLAPEARQALTRLAPALDRGIRLREYLLAALPPDHPGHADWPALRRFLSACPDRDLAELVDTAADARIAWYRRELDTDPTIEALLDRADRRGRSIARVARIDAALRLWGVPSPVHIAGWVADPEWLRHELLTLLDGLWTAGLSRTWRERRVEPATMGAGETPRAWVTEVTGLRPDAEITAALDRAERVVCSPCPGLGTALSVTEVAGTAWVLYEPTHGTSARPRPDHTAGEPTSPPTPTALTAAATTPAPHSPATSTSPATPHATTPATAATPSPATAQATLAELTPVVTALGDPTRIALLIAIGAGRATAGRLAAELGISLSTVSRQIATLERAGLVRITRDAGIRHHELARDAVRVVCRALEEQLG